MPRLATLVALGALVAACAEDVVLPDLAVDPVCGNGIREPAEECDVESPGCVLCTVVPTWRCTGDGCSQQCGDGVLGDGAECQNPHRDAMCDLTGFWAVRETDYTRDNVVNAIQVSSNWFLYRLAQTGDDFMIVESLDCGLRVTGSAGVDYSPGMLRAALYLNRMDLAAPRGPRRGTSRAEGGGCSITLDRFYRLRGLAEEFLPADFGAKPALASLRPLPKVNDPVNGREVPVGAIDPDGDGIPGAAFSVTGFVAGIRNSAQRDWKEYATKVPAPAGAVTLSVPGAFDVEESVLRVTQCGRGCGLLASGASPANLPGRLTMTFIGKDLEGTRVSRVVSAKPREDIEADLTTCGHVRLLLPHDASTP
jgi:hypothetical protein